MSDELVWFILWTTLWLVVVWFIIRSAVLSALMRHDALKAAGMVDRLSPTGQPRLKPGERVEFIGASADVDDPIEGEQGVVVDVIPPDPDAPGAGWGVLVAWASAPTGVVDEAEVRMVKEEQG